MFIFVPFFSKEKSLNCFTLKFEFNDLFFVFFFKFNSFLFDKRKANCALTLRMKIALRSVNEFYFLNWI